MNNPLHHLPKLATLNYYFQLIIQEGLSRSLVLKNKIIAHFSWQHLFFVGPLIYLLKAVHSLQNDNKILKDSFVTLHADNQKINNTLDRRLVEFALLAVYNLLSQKKIKATLANLKAESLALTQKVTHLADCTANLQVQVSEQAQTTTAGIIQLQTQLDATSFLLGSDRGSHQNSSASLMAELQKMLSEYQRLLPETKIADHTLAEATKQQPMETTAVIDLSTPMATGESSSIFFLKTQILAQGSSLQVNTDDADAETNNSSISPVSTNITPPAIHLLQNDPHHISTPLKRTLLKPAKPGQTQLTFK